MWGAMEDSLGDLKGVMGTLEIFGGYLDEREMAD
jgi:hypothetical protein